MDYETIAEHVDHRIEATDYGYCITIDCVTCSTNITEITNSARTAPTAV